MRSQRFWMPVGMLAASFIGVLWLVGTPLVAGCARSPWSRWPCHLTRRSVISYTPSTSRIAAAAVSTTSGSTPSRSRRPIRRAERASSQTTPPATANPAKGSIQATSNAAPIPAATTASEVNASLRACWPSAINASDPMGQYAISSLLTSRSNLKSDFDKPVLCQT